MPETWQELEQQLEKHQQDKTTNEQAIRETVKLLKKADQRRRANPAEKSKWGRTLDNLEDTLSEKKRLLTSSDTNIQQISRKLENGDYAPEDAEDGVEEPEANTEATVPSGHMSVPENLSLDDLKAAVRRVLSIHIIKIHTVSDLDVKLAAALLASRAAKNLSSEDTVELRKRLNILGKKRAASLRSTPPPPSAKVEDSQPESQDDGRIQQTMQSALKKCTEKNMSAMTLEEIEVLAIYRDALLKKETDASKGLAPVIQDALKVINERLSSISFG